MLMTRVAVLMAALLMPLAAPAPAVAQAAPTYTYQGTVHAVNARTHTLELITGVGMALRLVKMSAPSATGLAVLKPGDRVRAECRRTENGLTADRIEKVEVATP